MELDVFKQYFEAECVYNEVELKGVPVTLTSTSGCGEITYAVTISFFRTGMQRILRFLMMHLQVRRFLVQRGDVSKSARQSSLRNCRHMPMNLRLKWAEPSLGISL